MTKHYNITPLKVTRRKLRQDQTFLEEVLWAQLRDRKCLGIKFRRQYSIDKFVIDFYSPEIKLAIELDGGIHTKPVNRDYDIKRQQYIEKFGITFCRISNEEYEGNPEKALKKIEAAAKALSTSKHEPLPFKKGEGDRVGFVNA